MRTRQIGSPLDQRMVQAKTTVHILRSNEKLNGRTKKLQKLFTARWSNGVSATLREVITRWLLSIALRLLATGNIFSDRNVCWGMFTGW
jgi:hypothetical protein